MSKDGYVPLDGNAGDLAVGEQSVAGGSGGLQPGEPLTQIVGDSGGVGYSSPDNVPIFAFREDGDAHDRVQVWADSTIKIGDGTAAPQFAVNINAGVLIVSGPVKFNSNALGFFAHAPAPQQATPVTLGNVIALLQAYGLCP